MNRLQNYKLGPSRWKARPGFSLTVVQALRLVFAEPSVVHWGIDDWQQPQDTFTMVGMLGLQVADLASEALEAGQRLVFSIQDLTTENWIENDRVIEVVAEDTAAHELLVQAAGRYVDREAAD
jgi:hypothetical protein